LIQANPTFAEGKQGNGSETGPTGFATSFVAVLGVSGRLKTPSLRSLKQIEAAILKPLRAF